MENNLLFEPDAKTRVATAMSASLSFSAERKYLDGIDSDQTEFELRPLPNSTRLDAKWIAIRQVGRPLEHGPEQCFTAIQKILYSCFRPKEVQLLFLIIGDGDECSMYLGLRGPQQLNRHVKHLNEFMKGIWPGVQTTLVDEDDPVIAKFKKDVIDEDRLENVYALTGIPSMESVYQNVYPATIDTLLAGMNKSRGFAYLVVADPIDPNEVETMLYTCREMAGQAESLRTISLNETRSEGSSRSTSHTTGTSESTSSSKAVTRSGASFDVPDELADTALGMAANLFPAAVSMIEGCFVKAGQALLKTGKLVLPGADAVADYIGKAMPKVTTTRSEQHGTSTSDTEAESTNEGRSQSIGKNIVNKHIEAIGEQLAQHAKRFATGKAMGLWTVGAYLLAEKESDAESGALQLRSIMSGQESYNEPVRVHRISDLLNQQIDGKRLMQQSFGQLTEPILEVYGASGKRFVHPWGQHYQELKSVLTTKELSCLINFPLRSVPGISVVDSSPEFSLTKPFIAPNKVAIQFGNLLYGGSETKMEYKMTVDSLAKHTLISGINGCGKTNTVQAILNSLQGQAPFLVIEPAKTEYVDWAIEYNEAHPDNKIAIYVPGCKNYKDKRTRQKAENIGKLKLNPFEVVWLEKDQEPNVLSHIDRLKSTFAAAFPMYDILPVLMEDLLYTIYQNKSTNWLTAEPQYGVTLPPTLNSMSVSVDKVIRNRGYEERVERNMKACFNTRIDSLKRGWKGEMLNTTVSTPWEEVFGKPCVINLSYVGDDVDKSFFMALILQFLYEYRTAQAETGQIDFNANGCRHLTIIEEAHRVMMRCDNPEMPQYKSAMMFSNMLSEIRAYGEGLLLVDQVPTRLIPDAIKNTNTKITHRLVAEDDCKAIAESMGISPEQRLLIPKLGVGQCIVSTSLSPDKHWVKVNKVK